MYARLHQHPLGILVIERFGFRVNSCTNSATCKLLNEMVNEIPTNASNNYIQGASKRALQLTYICICKL
jgi:hypothetical protein